MVVEKNLLLELWLCRSLQIEGGWLSSLDRFIVLVFYFVSVLAFVYNNRSIIPEAILQTIQASLSQMRMGIY